MGHQPGAAPEAVPPSYPSGTSLGLAGYSPMMPPPQAYSQHSEASSQAPHRFIKPEDTQTHVSSRHQHQTSMGPTSPTTAPTAPSPSFSRLRPPDSKSPRLTAVKNSALSLSSITSPYNPEQSKNYHAQTLMLGERLRPGHHQALEGPAAPSFGTTSLPRIHRLAPRRRCITTALRRVARHRRIICIQGPLGGPVILPLDPQILDQHATTIGNA